MTLQQIADAIKDRLRNYNDTSQDSDLSDESIVYDILNHRALYLRREINKTRSLKTFEQDLGCLDLQTIDKSECPNFLAYETVKRTRVKLPKFIRRRNKEAITFVGDVNKTRRIPLDDTFMIEWNKYNKYTNAETKAYYLNDYIYVDNCEGLKAINVRGVLEDPTSPLLGDNAFDLESEDFPLPADLIHQLIEDIVASHMRTSEQTMEDIPNDREDIDGERR